MKGDIERAQQLFTLLELNVASNNLQGTGLILKADTPHVLHNDVATVCDVCRVHLNKVRVGRGLRAPDYVPPGGIRHRKPRACRGGVPRPPAEFPARAMPRTAWARAESTASGRALVELCLIHLHSEHAYPQGTP